MKGFKDKNNKFHPIRGYKGVRKSDRKKKETEPFPVAKSQTIPRGKLIQMQREAGIRGKKDESQMMALPIDMSVREQMEWENAVDSEIVKVKHEMMDGRPITSVRFANGEEWFEFDSVDHQEDFIKENDIEIDEEVVGEFVEVNHPIISGYITMPSGKVAFGEKEDTRMKREGMKIKPEFRKGQIVMVSPDNDNENYDDFRGKKLRIVNVAVNTDQHQGFDESVEEALYDFETLDGKPVHSSLYDYELVKA